MSAALISRLASSSSGPAGQTWTEPRLLGISTALEVLGLQTVPGARPRRAGRGFAASEPGTLPLGALGPYCFGALRVEHGHPWAPGRGASRRAGSHVWDSPDRLGGGQGTLVPGQDSLLLGLLSKKVHKGCQSGGSLVAQVPTLPRKIPAHSKSQSSGKPRVGNWWKNGLDFAKSRSRGDLEDEFSSTKTRLATGPSA